MIAAVRNRDDLAAVARLFAAYAASLDIDLGYQDFAAELAGLPGEYAPPAGELLLARAADGEPIGCVALRPLGDGACEMKRLYVGPAGRGQGHGQALMAAIVAEARSIGYRELRLDTLPTMVAAQALYRAAGFAPVAPYYEGAPAGTLFMGLPLDELYRSRPSTSAASCAITVPQPSSNP